MVIRPLPCERPSHVVSCRIILDIRNILPWSWDSIVRVTLQSCGFTTLLIETYTRCRNAEYANGACGFLVTISFHVDDYLNLFRISSDMPHEIVTIERWVFPPLCWVRIWGAMIMLMIDSVSDSCILRAHATAAVFSKTVVLGSRFTRKGTWPSCMEFTKCAPVPYYPVNYTGKMITSLDFGFRLNSIANSRLDFISFCRVRFLWFDCQNLFWISLKRQSCLIRYGDTVNTLRWDSQLS
jgi:hypothetical protein